MPAPRSALLVAGLVTAISAFLLSNPAFVPLAERFEGEGAEIRHRFTLTAPDSIYLNYELVLRAGGNVRPTVRVQLNDVVAATLPVEALSVQQLGRVHLPAAATRAGANDLVVTAEGGLDASIELHARLHNYSGIAPDVPRAAVVADEAWRLWWSQSSRLAIVGRFVACCVGALLVLAIFQKTTSTDARGWRLFAPSALVTPVLLWALATPRHVWLFPETLALLVFAPCLMLAAIGLLRRRRVPVFEIAGIAAITLLLLEVALRVTNTISPSFIFYADSYGRYRGRPGAPHHGSTLNSRGFNDQERSVQRPVQVVTRIVALGDSFAFGVVPRPANYLTLIEQMLSADGAVEVINLGVAGTEPRDYRAIFVDEGLQFRPDLVLISAYIGNDLEVRRPRWYERSYVTTLLNFLWNLHRARQTVIVAEGALAPYEDDEPSLDSGTFERIQMERAWLYTSTDEALSAASTRAVADLVEIRDLARGIGADCIVVLIPDETQVNPSLQREVARAWGRVSIDFNRPTRVVAAALARAGLPAIDLLPAFVAAGSGVRLYKPRDTHWNIAGNRVAAEAILPALQTWLERRRTDSSPR